MRQSNPKWIALQGLAILGSILLAFGIEAWWSDRQDAGEASRILAALELETVANLGEIAEISKYRHAVSKVCDDVLGASADSLTAAEFDTHLADLTWWDTANIAVGALTSLTDGGKLALVDDPNLVLQISKVLDFMAKARLIEKQEQRATDDFLIPLLLRNGSMTQIANIQYERGLPGGKEWEPSPPVPDKGGHDHRNLLSDDEFRGIVVIQKWSQHDSLYGYKVLEDAMNELLVLLRED
jgi:hypothetical protein